MLRLLNTAYETENKNFSNTPLSMNEIGWSIIWCNGQETSPASYRFWV